MTKKNKTIAEVVYDHLTSANTRINASPYPDRYMKRFEFKDGSAIIFELGNYPRVWIGIHKDWISDIVKMKIKREKKSGVPDEEIEENESYYYEDSVFRYLPEEKYRKYHREKKNKKNT